VLTSFYALEKHTVKIKRKQQKDFFKYAFFIVKKYRTLLIFFLQEIIILFLYQQDLFIKIMTDIPNM